MNDGQKLVDMGDLAATGRVIRTAMNDPLDTIWIHAVARLGWKVRRSREVYAHWDGVGTMTVTDRPDYDPDDTLAQFLFHEICHFLVEGEDSRPVEDWGLSNLDPDVWVREAAAHRLQAALADRWGLREFLAITGANRDYWDALPPDPIHMPHPTRPDTSSRTGEMAVKGWHLAAREPYRSILEEALQATSDLALTVARLPGQTTDSHWSSAAPPHPLRLGTGPQGRFCADCAWNRSGRCLQADGPWAVTNRLPKNSPACARWETRLTESDCGTCGACCREGYTLAPVRPGEAVLTAHPEWIQGRGRKACLPRPNGRCVALDGQGSPASPWRCRDYEARPRACSELEVGGSGCLQARRRTGLSAGG